MSEEKLNLSKAKAAILGAFAVDAFSLSYHWVYDVTQIPNPLQAVLAEPASKFHKEKGKVKGDLTHVGDLSFLLLQEIAETKKFDLADFSGRFKALLGPNYKGWVTGYAKHVLKALESNVDLDKVGDPVDDTDPIGRIGPLLLIHDNVADFTADAKKYVAFTINNENVLKSTEFFSQVLFKVLGGSTPVAAIEATIKLDAFANNKFLVDAVHAGLASKNDNTVDTIKKFGQSCTASGGIPGIIHLLAKYENDLTKASVENVQAGGDSTARGMVVGLILGAYLGADHLPPYTKDIKAYNDILQAFKQFN